jgi:transposase
LLHNEQRVVALIGLLSIALRVLGLIQCVVRRNLQQADATLKGIYPGQPGRATAQPTTEMMLGAFRGVTLSRIKVNGKLLYHLTPWNTVQRRILALMEVPRDIYAGLVT